MSQDARRPPVPPSPPLAATAIVLTLAAVLASSVSAVAAPSGGTAPRSDTVMPADPFASHSHGSVTVADAVDAPGTGLGAIRGAGAAARFYGIDGDADAFARLVERFLAFYDRAGSPLFLFGHSYGTVRSAALARRLTEDDVDPGTDEPNMFALPI